MVHNIGRVKRTERKPRVANLYLEGWTNVEIAKELGVSAKVIGRDVAELRQEWSTTALDKWEECLGQELVGIAKIEREAWKAWHRSIDEREERKPKATDGDPAKDDAAKTAKAGDSRFLDIALKCSDKRERLLGLGDPEVRERAGREREGRAPVVEIIIHSREQIPKFLDYSEFEARQVAPIQVEGENSAEIDYADPISVDGVPSADSPGEPPAESNGNGHSGNGNGASGA